MTNDQAESVLRAIRAAYPSAQLGPDTIQLWMNLLAPIEHSVAVAAVEDHVRHAMFFPTPAEFEQRLKAQTKDQRLNEAALAKVKCDGSGWLQLNPPRPCPTCSPAAAKIFADDYLLASYKRGRALHEVLGISKAEFQDEYWRPACKPSVPQEAIDRERTLTFDEGRSVAAESYAEECRRQGRDPNWHFFDSIFTRSTK